MKVKFSQLKTGQQFKLESSKRTFEKIEPVSPTGIEYNAKQSSEGSLKGQLVFIVRNMDVIIEEA